MLKIEPTEHPILFKYVNTLTRIIGSMFPQMDSSDIRAGINYSISKRFKNFNLSIHNNYTNKDAEMTALEMCDYIDKRQPIMTPYGVLFKRHNDVPNPTCKVIDSFLALRKKNKKEMFKYPKGSEMFEHFNLLQNLNKIDTNAIYGLLGLYVSFLYDLNIAPTVTAIGRSLISSAILCFEGFLGNNVKFGSLDEIVIFIDNVRMEQSNWKYDDYKVLGKDGMVDINETFYKLISNCGYKYIPTTEDLDVVYKILQGCNQIELNRLFYKNNLYCFMDLPIARNLLTYIVTHMTKPYIEPAKPPKEIKGELDQLKDYLLEYVFYCHQYIDRVDRNKNMIKKISLVSDTDSSFVSLDAWYNYNIEYLKNYDCPIMHQTLDVVKFMEAETKKEDFYWKDKEIPEWWNANNKDLAFVNIEVDEDGDLIDKHAYDAVSYEDPELDYDFYNEEIIERKRMINPFKVIPQDNMRFALINIMCYVLTDVINLYMIDFTKESQSFRGEEFCRINMKNEFYISRIMLKDAKKNYASLQRLQEGNYLGDTGKLDCKGIECLTKSTSPVETRKALQKILLEDIMTGNPDQLKIIKDMAILENQIYNDLKNGSKKYFKPLVVKSIAAYKNPLSQQGVKASLVWNYVKGDAAGIDLGERNSVDVIKIKIDKNSLERIRYDYPEQFEKFSDLIDKDTDSTISGISIKEVFKSGVSVMALPKDIEVPNWIRPLIDYETIIQDNISGFPVDSVGISQLDAKKPNYSNIIKL